VGKRPAIIRDGTVCSSPVIREKISGGRAQIRGSFSDEEAMSFAIALRAGALAAQVEVTELRELEHSARVSTDSASPETPQAPPLPSLP